MSCSELILCVETISAGGVHVVNCDYSTIQRYAFALDLYTSHCIVFYRTLQEKSAVFRMGKWEPGIFWGSAEENGRDRERKICWQRQGERDSDRVWECLEGLTLHSGKEFGIITIAIVDTFLQILHRCHITKFKETHQQKMWRAHPGTNQAKPKLKHSRLLLNPLSTHSYDIIHGCTDAQIYRHTHT